MNLPIESIQAQPKGDDALASPMFRDPSRPVPERVADLLARMTTEEKIAQLGSGWVFEIAKGDHVDAALADKTLQRGIGHITRISGASHAGGVVAATLANQMQEYLRDHTRLGIPAIVHEEICSGLMAREATAFPQAIGIASTFRPEHNRVIADAIRAQMRAIGAHQGLSPVLDICRDARWGRLEETYGEDPYLVSQMGMAFVTGLQGDDLRTGVVATAKHFVGYGASDGGMNWAPSNLPGRQLRDVYLRPFEAAVRDANLQSIMNSYSEIDGVPCAANHSLWSTVLRDGWGFDGTVVSDYFAVRQLESYHRVVESGDDAATLALAAGIDVELPSTDCYSVTLVERIEADGELAAVVDRAVSRVLATKFRLGLFESPLVDVDAVPTFLRPDRERAIADAAARDSLILLKNDGLLPLPPTAQTIAVIGPNADDPRNLMGDYSFVAHVESFADVLRSGQSALFEVPEELGVQVDEDVDLRHVSTVLRALQGALPDSKFLYERGCDVLSDDRSGFDAAVDAARGSDVAILVLGDKAGLTDGCTSGESNDVSSLSLPGVQEELVLAVAATGVPVVLVLVAGRPTGSPSVHDAAAAVLMAWLPGERGGGAVAAALTGAFSPGGKLPVSYPRSSGQIPVFYGHKRSGGRSHWKGPYVDLSNEPLYPFGYGLTYSDFELDVDPLDAIPARSGEVIPVITRVRNVGSVAADEVVQLYVHDPVASITRPVLELQAFFRVSLAAGEEARVVFHLATDSLGFSGNDLDYRLEAGTIELFVGTSSVDLAPAGSIVLGGDLVSRVDRVHTNAAEVRSLSSEMTTTSGS